MNYQETVNWMFKQLPMYQNQGKSAYKTDLTNTIDLAKHLKHPENKFKSIHVAGTNGKGSCSHMLASILQEAGYKVGLYTSPHLKDFRERIKINGQPITKQFVIGFIKRNSSFFRKQRLSFFEMTVGMAFEYFAKKKVDIAIIEVGLGGRLDSTNIITPEVSLITNIGFDHMEFLGNTYEKIAKEKAGIIKSNVPVVIGETQKETKGVFNEIANANNAEIYFADQEHNLNYQSDLLGSYQVKNIKSVVKTIKVLRDQGLFDIKDEYIERGLLKVVQNTGLLGRWQVLQKSPTIICDTAHNKEGLNYVIDQLNTLSFSSLHIVFGVVNDKDLNSIIPLMPTEATYYFCKPNVPRGMDSKILKEKFENAGFIGQAYGDVNKALISAKNAANPDDLIYVGGSTFVVAEVV